MNKYENIIDLPRPEDLKHKPMSLHNRAAQFAPFDALTGFGGRIYETSRLTRERIELSDEMKSVINEKLRQISMNIKSHPMVSVTYFIPDKTKSGGDYQTLSARVLKINAYDERLLLEDEISIAFDDITELQILR